MTADLVLSDTCTCGAAFTVHTLVWSHATNRHDVWLAEHKPCRDAWVEGRKKHDVHVQ